LGNFAKGYGEVPPIRLLIALRDKPLLSLYSDFLSRDGFEVVAAPDGLWCVNLLHGFVPDLVVVDPALPWGGGDGLVAWIREECHLPQVPVLALATRSNQAPLPPSTFPVDLYLHAPPSPELLAKTLRGLLRIRVQEDPAAPNDPERTREQLKSLAELSYESARKDEPSEVVEAGPKFAKLAEPMEEEPGLESNVITRSARRRELAFGLLKDCQVGTILAALDLIDPMVLLMERIVILLERARDLKSNTDFERQREELEKEARQIMGEVDSLKVLGHVFEHGMAELLSNPRLKAATKAEG
jgi:DNA-binding response OmpR family regulator